MALKMTMKNVKVHMVSENELHKVLEKFMKDYEALLLLSNLIIWGFIIDFVSQVDL